MWIANSSLHKKSTNIQKSVRPFWVQKMCKKKKKKVAHLWQQWPAVRTLKALMKNVGFAQICKFATKRNLSCLWICKNLRIYGYCVLCTFFAVISVPPHPLALKANHRELVYCSKGVNIVRSQTSRYLTFGFEIMLQS